MGAGDGASGWTNKFFSRGGSASNRPEGGDSAPGSPQLSRRPPRPGVNLLPDLAGSSRELSGREKRDCDVIGKCEN